MKRNLYFVMRIYRNALSEYLLYDFIMKKEIECMVSLLVCLFVMCFVINSCNEKLIKLKKNVGLNFAK